MGRAQHLRLQGFCSSANPAETVDRFHWPFPTKACGRPNHRDEADNSTDGLHNSKAPPTLDGKCLLQLITVVRAGGSGKTQVFDGLRYTTTPFRGFPEKSSCLIYNKVSGGGRAARSHPHPFGLSGSWGFIRYRDGMEVAELHQFAPFHSSQVPVFPRLSLCP